MKNVVAFVASGRKHRGLTYAATRGLLDRLESYGDVRTEIVFLSEQDLGLCRGCKACFERGEERCPLKGDRDALIAKMEEADAVVLASPNYAFQVSAVMKAFLDRLGFLFHRPRFHGKAFTAVVAQGILGGTKIRKYLELVGFSLGFDVVAGSCVTALEPATDRDRERMARALDRQSRRLHAQLSKPAGAAPSVLQLLAFRMARTSIGQTLGPENRDYVYYRDRGWLEADYYAPTSLGPLKKALGAAFDWVFARIYRRKALAPRPAPLAIASKEAAEGSAR